MKKKIFALAVAAMAVLSAQAQTSWSLCSAMLPSAVLRPRL